MSDLQQHLTDNPQIKTVYFNTKGEWLFGPNPNFPIEKTREDILETEIKQTTKKAK